MAEPPLLAGVNQFKTIWFVPAVAVTDSGSVGLALAGVLVASVESRPSPSAFSAETWK